MKKSHRRTYGKEEPLLLVSYTHSNNRSSHNEPTEIESSDNISLGSRES